MVSQFLERVLQTLVMENRLQDGMQQIIVSTLKKNLGSAMEELEKICEDEKFQPLTYNHYFTDSIQKDRLDEVQRVIETAIDEDCIVENPQRDPWPKLKLKPEGIVIKRLTEVDMREQACKEAKSSLDAYYKVSTPR